MPEGLFWPGLMGRYLHMKQNVLSLKLSYTYSELTRSLYLSRITRRLSLRVGVSSPFSMDHSAGISANFLICSTGLNSRLYWFTACLISFHTSWSSSTALFPG